jgi:hypothetical protein
MSLDIQTHGVAAELFEREIELDFDSDLNAAWAENVVTATAAAFTVLFVSAVAVLMYLA